MGDAVVLVLLIGLHESRHDLVDARRAVQRNRRGIARGHPALHQELAQAIDVVGVEMGQEDRRDTAMDEAHLADVAGAAIAGVEHKQALAGHDHRAGPQAPVVGHRRAGAAQPDVQAVRQFIQGVGGQAAGGDALGHGHAERRAENIGGGTGDDSRRNGQKGDTTEFHGGTCEKRFQTPNMRASRTKKPWIQGAT